MTVVLHELPMPQLGGEDADEGGVVAEAGQRARTGFLVKARDGAGIEKSGACNRLLAQALSDTGLNLPVDEGTAVRRPVGLLWPVDNRVWDKAFRHAAQDVLFLEPLQLCLRRKPASEFHHPMIEEREAALNPVCHRHPVALAGEDVARQEKTRFEELGLVERMPTAKVSREARRQVFGSIVTAKGCLEFIRIEDLGGGGAAKARPVGEKQVVGPVGASAEVGRQVLG